MLIQQMRAVAVFSSDPVYGVVLFTQVDQDVRVDISMDRLPSGEHGIHIHKSGDLRQGCKSLCDHWSSQFGSYIAQRVHGGPPPLWSDPIKRPMPLHEILGRHTGDLGNVSTQMRRVSYRLQNVSVEELLGRSVIVHEDADDYGAGLHEDSKTTGHSGTRIACALIGRIDCETA